MEGIGVDVIEVQDFLLAYEARKPTHRVPAHRSIAMPSSLRKSLVLKDLSSSSWPILIMPLPSSQESSIFSSVRNSGATQRRIIDVSISDVSGDGSTRPDIHDL